jgi:hypothetical protein
MEHNSTENERISNSLQKVLNKHGYNFQYAVLRRFFELNKSPDNIWKFEAAEFPVSTKGKSTHIDFILFNQREDICLIGECKRVNPAFAWCFAKAPYTWRNSNSSELFFDQIVVSPPNIIKSQPHFALSTSPILNLGLVLKTNKPGECNSSGREDIDNAVAQVLRGSNGLINHLFINNSTFPYISKYLLFFPVIFTTAPLWITNADLGTADITTGELSDGTIEVKKVDWLFYNYHRSLDLHHDFKWECYENNLSKELKNEFARSIAIVNPNGFDNFMKLDWFDLLRE